MSQNKDSETMGVIGGAKWCFSPNLYKRIKMRFPMTVEHKLGHVGKSSYTFCHTFHDSFNGEALVQGVKLLVNTDSNTRRSTTLSGPFLRKYAELSNPKKAIKISTQNMSDHNGQVHGYTLQARPSDMDFLYHVNQTSYVKFVLDAAADASMTGKLTNFPEDITEYNVAEVEVANKAQCWAGDHLVVYTWEDSKDKLILHSQINRQETVVALCKLRFHPFIPSSKL